MCYRLLIDNKNRKTMGELLSEKATFGLNGHF